MSVGIAQCVITTNEATHTIEESLNITVLRFAIIVICKHADGQGW